MTVEFVKTPYAGWNNTYKLSNGTIELIITGDVGPRIVYFGFVGDVNEFCEVPDDLGKIGGDEWRMYGGHRFWHGPEVEGRTNLPDNDPVEITEKDGSTWIFKEDQIYAIQKEQVKEVRSLKLLSLIRMLQKV